MISGDSIFYNTKQGRDFPGGPVVKLCASNAWGTGLIPGRGTKISHAVPCGQNIKKKLKKKTFLKKQSNSHFKHLSLIPVAIGPDQTFGFLTLLQRSCLFLYFGADEMVHICKVPGNMLGS